MTGAMQAVAFIAPLLSWARTAVDPSFNEDFMQWGRFPLTPREQRSCIKGIIAREGVGKGDEDWQAYLAERGVVHITETTDWAAETREDELVGITKVCLVCE